MPIDKSAQQVRRLIHTFVDSGEMKVTDFQSKMGVSSKAYYNFMNQHGTDEGNGCNLYFAAWAFFKKREMRGVPMPKKKKAKRTSDSSTTRSSSAKSASSVKAPGSETAAFDLSNIHLEGEQTDEVPVFDTCAEIRRKIGNHLKKNDVTSAGFLRDVAAQFHKEQKKIQSNSLSRFRSQKKTSRGNTNPMYYGAYCFFEKLRIAQDKPKSQHRQAMEERHGASGVNTTRPSGNTWITAPMGSSVYEDQYGCIQVV